MRRFDAAPRRATPKGHKTFISCTAAHQESRLPRHDSSLRAWHTNTVDLVVRGGREARARPDSSARARGTA
jgi:hypothetical protein